MEMMVERLFVQDMFHAGLFPWQYFLVIFLNDCGVFVYSFLRPDQKWPLLRLAWLKILSDKDAASITGHLCQASGIRGCGMVEFDQVYKVNHGRSPTK